MKNHSDFSSPVGYPSAWTIDRHALSVASEHGCDVVAILDADSNDTWTCALSQVKRAAVPISRRSEKQLAVPFERWIRLQNYTAVRVCTADQAVVREIPPIRAGRP